MSDRVAILRQMLVMNDQETHDFHAEWMDKLTSDYVPRA